jgi:hypothetical protein
VAAVLRARNARRNLQLHGGHLGQAGGFAGHSLAAGGGGHEPAVAREVRVRYSTGRITSHQLVADDITVIEVPANEIAAELGNPRGANMVALGAYLGATDAVSLDEVIEVIRETFAAKPAVIDVNIEALRKGFEIGASAKLPQPVEA